MFIQEVIEVSAIDAQELCGPALDAVGVAQCLQENFSLGRS
jgi:hypothetical protein